MWRRRKTKERNRGGRKYREIKRRKMRERNREGGENEGGGEG